MGKPAELGVPTMRFTLRILQMPSPRLVSNIAWHHMDSSSVPRPGPSGGPKGSAARAAAWHSTVPASLCNGAATTNRPPLAISPCKHHIAPNQ
ncbi:hypothetical protein GA0061093_11752 [Rhodococcus qingshengii]|nr:hypothetical protein GA0061093_11752 [Rhodococcus qingshengii]